MKWMKLNFSGGFGVDFSHDVETIEEGVAKVAKGVLAHGVTSFCPTLVSSHPDVYHKVNLRTTLSPSPLPPLHPNVTHD
jgi:N-acetylglucosamine-6-phosphate deacetylase